MASLARVNLVSSVRNTFLTKIIPIHFSKNAQSYSTAAKLSLEEPLKMPHDKKEFSPKIKQIVDDISKLTLLEVCDLNKLIKQTFDLPDAPIMSMQAAAVVQENKSNEEEEIIKSQYIVKLIKFDPTKKVALIKEVKNLLEGMNLVQAKKFVESIPQVLKTDVPKDEANELKNKLEAVGATIILI